MSAFDAEPSGADEVAQVEKTPRTMMQMIQTKAPSESSSYKKQGGITNM